MASFLTTTVHTGTLEGKTLFVQQNEKQIEIFDHKVLIQNGSYIYDSLDKLSFGDKPMEPIPVTNAILSRPHRDKISDVTIIILEENLALLSVSPTTDKHRLYYLVNRHGTFTISTPLRLNAFMESLQFKETPKYGTRNLRSKYSKLSILESVCKNFDHDEFLELLLKNEEIS